MKKYNLSEIMKRAWELVKKAGTTISDALKTAWKEAKNVAERIENAVIDTFAPYNVRRYSTPWVCKMENGNYNFNDRIGAYSAARGEGGDLVVFHPVAGQVYGYGQKDYRGQSYICFAKWDGTQFIKCDKLGESI